MTETGFEIPPISPGMAPCDTRVVVAMSGGVDSSVTAALLVEAGYDVVGMTLQLYDHGAAHGRQGTCCAGQDIHDARRVAERLGIPHYVLDYESRFREAVIDDFADSYLRGETPVPCIRCNQTMKFRDLLGMARDLGGAALATGHYARRETGKEGSELHRAVDRDRDQSYFLFATTRAQLDFLRFPLGGMPKTETRRHAERLGLTVAAKPDSQDICFVPAGRYAGIVAKLRPGAVEPGPIVHLDGRVLGAHEGIVNYTIGQRRGLGIGGRAEDRVGMSSGQGPAEAGSERLYVVGLEPETRIVRVGPARALERDLLEIGSCNWLDSGPPGAGEAGGAGRRASVRLRSTQEPALAHVTSGRDAEAEAGARATVTLLAPQRGIAPGQACVVYDGARVLGGGWIRSAGLTPALAREHAADSDTMAAPA